MAAADSLPNFTGYFLDDRYELVKLLGSGSFGVVYKAIDHEVAEGYENTVAVKILRKAGQSAAHLASIKREVAFHSTVADKEGVVTLFDTFDDAKWCYLVLDFCGGGDLFDQIVTWRTYLGNDELIRKAFLSLVDAVQGCHDAGIAHRDLKPENVLTNEDGSQCYLADFGLACNEPLVREFGVGTGLYMSPGTPSFNPYNPSTFALTHNTSTECVGDLTRRQSYDPFLSDVWSLGVILVNMITTQNPLARATAKDANFCRFLMDPDFLYNAYPMSDMAHTIIQSLLELDPAQRMSLSTLRQEILSIDTFFRPASPFEHVVLEHEYSTTPSELELATETSSASAAEPESEFEYGCEYEYKSTHMASEIDIPCASPEPDVRVARDCSAGSAVDSYSSPATTTTPSFSSVSYITNSCSSSRASSGTSDVEEVITPEGTTTTATTAHMLWDRIMAGAHLNKYQGAKEVRGYEGWQNGTTAQMLMAQYQYRNHPECYYIH